MLTMKLAALLMSIGSPRGCLIFFFICCCHSDALSLCRSNFPDGFIFGAASSAYQSEGASNQGGRGPALWDTFTLEYPEKIANHSNGFVADDFYQRYKTDVKLMKDIGLDSFRFSVSWSRILPNGKISGGVNQIGVQFYNDLIDELLANGLEDEYGGFLSMKIVDDFRDFADLCFKEFGDRVKLWITLNEPNYFSILGYAYGIDAPGRCSTYVGNCTAGNSGTEPYIVTHHQILSHLAAFNLYKNKYQASQKGKIGITVHTDWMVPIDQTPSNVMAASRAFDFIAGWILDPLLVGDYPQIMRSLVGSRLPKFTDQQSEMLKHSFHFLGLNYYSGFYAQDNNSSSTVERPSYTTDSQVTLTTEKDGVPIGEPTAWSEIFIYPDGLRFLLEYMKLKYGNPPIIITENGMCEWNNYSLPLKDALKDYQRIRYLSLHLLYLNKAIKNGANVNGYYVWSLMDDFEWSNGYIYRFGLHFVDFKDRLKRYPKLSAAWFAKFLYQNNTLKLYYTPSSYHTS